MGKTVEGVHYTSKEVLQILEDLYVFQAYYCCEINKGYYLTFQTTIGEWRKICDLKEPSELALDFQRFFSLDIDQSDLTYMLSVEKNNLGMFCDYVANKASKEIFPPDVYSEVAIFKILQTEFDKRGINTTDLKLSAKLSPFFCKHATDVVEIVSKLSPGTFSYYKFKHSIIGKLGILLLFFFYYRFRYYGNTSLYCVVYRVASCYSGNCFIDYR